ncbi:MAG: GIY-YIG nuclease family protein [Bacteroidetes bacterium]|nr:GIY-YIG nuclease family protein [Bacteroidota bacterium]
MIVYILQCSDNSYYTGVTNNLERRLSEHNSVYGENCYTCSRRPVRLMWFENFQTPMQAILIEKKIKRWTRKKKEALINGDWNKLRESAKCQNETSHENYNNKNS